MSEMVECWQIRCPLHPEWRNVPRSQVDEYRQSGWEVRRLAIQGTEPVAWEYQNQFGDKFLTRRDPDTWHPHDRNGFKEFRALVFRTATTVAGPAADRAELAAHLREAISAYIDSCMFRRQFALVRKRAMDAAIEALARSPEPVAEIPPLPGHPENHVMRWSQLEEGAITRYGRACYEAGALARSTDAPSERSEWPIKPLDRVQVCMKDGTHVMAKAVFPYFDAASMQELEDRATPPAASTSDKWAMSEAEYDRMVNGLMAQLGEISEALEISEDDQACANGNDAILAAIEDLKQPAASTSAPTLAEIEQHVLAADECPPHSAVVVMSAIRRLYDRSALAATTPAPACRAEPATDALIVAAKDLLATVERLRSTHPEEDETYTHEKWAMDVLRVALAAATDGGKPDIFAMTYEPVGAATEAAEPVALDAARWRKLRSMHWYDGPDTLAVVKAKDVQLGVQTYNEDFLEQTIDKVMQGDKK